MSALLSQRVLPGAERLDNTILIVSNSTFDTDHEIHLNLVAPGLKDLDKLRAGLCAWLKRSLTAVDPDWVHNVTIKPHFDNGESEIVVQITDPSILDNASLDSVLAMAKTYVAPFAAQNWRSVYVLQGEQRLVPLAFDRPLTTPTMEVILPQHLLLRMPMRQTARQLTRDMLGGIDTSMDSSSARCAYLAAALELEYDRHSWMDVITVRESGKGVHLVANFRGSMTPFIVNATQAIIMRVLERHATFDGINSDLVFVSTTPADDSYDDGGDYGDYGNQDDEF